jgi:hypothetical protein
MGRKVSDKFTVPICRLHHRELHRLGNERDWWEKKEIDPLSIAASLWKKTHDNVELTNLNGRRLASGLDAAHQPQNAETKPIVRPEAETE